MIHYKTDQKRVVPDYSATQELPLLFLSRSRVILGTHYTQEADGIHLHGVVLTGAKRGSRVDLELHHLQAFEGTISLANGLL